MILGLSIADFTILHVILSLIGIVSGIIVLFGMLGGKRLYGLTAIFLASTVLTSVTGFFSPLTKIGPPFVFGVISLALLVFALLGLYVFGLSGAWRWIYVVTAVLALYLNSVVGV